MFFIRGTVDWSCFSWLQEEEGRAEEVGCGLEEGREGDLEMETGGRGRAQRWRQEREMGGEKAGEGRAAGSLGRA